MDNDEMDYSSMESEETSMDLVDPNDLNNIGMPPYNAEYFQNQHNLRHSPYHRQLIEAIEMSRLSLKAKKMLMNTINGYFDQTVFLSNMSNAQTGDKELSEIRLEITMLMMTLGYKRTDRLKAELVNIEAMLRDHMSFIFSRSVGKERERNLQNKFTHGSETGTMTEDKEDKKRRGFFK